MTGSGVAEEPSGAPGVPLGRSRPGPAPAVRRASILALAAVVVAVDQATKTWALHRLSDGRTIHLIWTLRLALTFNSGAAFGLGRGVTPLLVALAIVLIVLLVGLGRDASRRASAVSVVAMGLLLGGAAGNLVDRLARHHAGAVIDFIDLKWWPVFNVADASIVCGAVLLLLGARQPNR
jgi:signal peptidase II